MSDNEIRAAVALAVQSRLDRMPASTPFRGVTASAARAGAETALNTAMPLIEARVREKVLREVLALPRYEWSFRMECMEQDSSGSYLSEDDIEAMQKGNR